MPVRVGLKTIPQWKCNLENSVLACESRSEKTGQIVFYGPSYFTRWSARFGIRPLAECLPGRSGCLCVVNRGFGTSSCEHQLYYYPRMIRPLAPTVLVYECFGNSYDLGYTQEEILELGSRVVIYAETDFPDLRVYVCSPHPRRDYDAGDIKAKLEFSLRLQDFVRQRENRRFINVLDYPAFYLNGNVSARVTDPDIFVDDEHFNTRGYALYTELFRRELREELDRF